MKRIAHTVLFTLALGLVQPTLHAHCDTLDGPVVLAARAALDTGDLAPVLIWVKPAEESEVRAAFERARSVRAESKAAAGLADTWFFETVVRLHRAGEGAPYTGLKSGPVEEPGIVEADHALETGSPDELVAATVKPLEAALRAKYREVRERKEHASHNVEAGRAYVAAYVDYVHFAERLATLATGHAAHGAPAAHAH